MLVCTLLLCLCITLSADATLTLHVGTSDGRHFVLHFRIILDSWQPNIRFVQLGELNTEEVAPLYELWTCSELRHQQISPEEFDVDHYIHSVDISLGMVTPEAPF